MGLHVLCRGASRALPCFTCICSQAVKEFRRIVITMIMSTDMAKHFEFLSDFRTMVEEKRQTSDSDSWVDMSDARSSDDTSSLYSRLSAVIRIECLFYALLCTAQTSAHRQSRGISAMNGVSESCTSSSARYAISLSLTPHHPYSRILSQLKHFPP